MVEAPRVTYYPDTQDLFILFEEGRPTVGITENASEYEVFADDELLSNGITKIVAVEILDMEHFNPDKAIEIPTEFKQVVAEAYYRYSPKNKKTSA